MIISVSAIVQEMLYKMKSGILLYSTGDYEDPPEIAEDKECLCYYVWCDSPNRRNEFYSQNGHKADSIRFMCFE